ncbi:PEP-CTERM sorting domain-containing protein [Geobacter pickeringii]|uniref:Ice-binding protein C-terminal domain-containing protein n=1 Tax=Geobacter pickeringii TaxID=345632 RepID=A0A0B5BCG3_9BACT|nr:PEP-CTERM sorting domain-containing protein [Geobacter pickeringii]AJE02764.1 hypothetical protein GPICK_04715 [Geobacter pickeringii]
MKKFFLLFAVLVLMTGGLVEVSEALLFSNPGFESGDLTGWTVDTGFNGVGSADVVQLHIGSDRGTVYRPREGRYFAVLTSGDIVTDNLGQAVPGSRPTTISQSFSVGAGTRIRGWAAFDAGDFAGFGDYGFVRIFDSMMNQVAEPFFAQIPPDTSKSFFDGPWTRWFWTAPLGGIYTLAYGVADVGDDPLALGNTIGYLHSQLLTDQVEVAPVPEPSTFLLLGAGLGGIVFMRKKLSRRRGI